jgi:hypothetical protein
MLQIFASLDEVATRLGREKAVQIVEFSLPYISQKGQQLNDALIAAEWESAAHYAHKAISSVRLFGSAKLETLLVQIRDGNIDQDTMDIQQELLAEFTDVQNAVNAWLIQHK